jgi:cupin superfamily acireductone dioxygenase involved in methionine salvage
MPKWLVSLQGDSVDLQELADEFRSAHLSVRKEQDRYFLRSSEYFDALTSSEKVRARASELLPLLVGSIKLRTGYTEAITLGDLTIRVEDDGTHSQYTELETLRVRSKMPEVWVSSGPRISTPPLAERWVDLALRDEMVLDALRFFQEETTWWSLRKTYEVIETELQPSKIAKLGWASVPEIKRFKEWASYYVHGEQKGYPNENYHPYLSLPEAESFMQQMLLKWLQRKLENP